MVAIFVLLLAVNAPGARSDAASQIAAIEARLGGRMGIAALDTGSGKRLDYRAEERFPMCSTFKFLAAACYFETRR
jgi:beta-lactamase class A